MQEAYISEQEALECVRQSGIISDYSDLKCTRITQGYMKDFFRVSTPENQSVLVKYLFPGTTLNRTENLTSEALKLQNRYAGESIPDIYFIKNRMVIMEDVLNYTPMNSTLSESVVDLHLSCSLSRAMVNISFRTSELFATVKKFINSEHNARYKEQIQKKYFTETGRSILQNKSYTTQEKEFILEELYHLEKHFSEDNECLLHGNLTPEAVYLKGRNAKIFNRDMGYYGPAGFDPGIFTAELLTEYLKPSGSRSVLDLILSLHEGYYGYYSQLLTYEGISYSGFLKDLSRDVLNFTAVGLIPHMEKSPLIPGIIKVILMGKSTSIQDIIKSLKKGNLNEKYCTQSS